MATRNYNVLSKCFFVCCCVTAVTALTLPYLTTRKPRVTKYMTPSSNSEYPGSIENLKSENEPFTTTTEESTSSAMYRVNSSEGTTCILLRTDGLLSIKYNTKLGEEREADVFVPDKADVSGDCRDEDLALMKIAWPGFTLDFRFEKTPGGERWYLDKVELTFDTSNRRFEHLGRHDPYVKLTTNVEHSAMLFPTPVGRSFTCSGNGEEMPINLMQPQDGENRAGATHFSGTLFLRDLRLQPFMYKSNEFSPPFQCHIGGLMRDETAPIAVGSTLAITVLGTITGYGIFRYFKVKKVQYDTME